MNYNDKMRPTLLCMTLTCLITVMEIKLAVLKKMRHTLLCMTLTCLITVMEIKSAEMKTNEAYYAMYDTDLFNHNDGDQVSCNENNEA